MQTITLIGLLLGGVLLLYLGAELLIFNAKKLSLALGMSMLTTGLVVISFCTSTPELTSSLIAQLKGGSDIALGNIVGTNIANIGLILGFVLLFKPLKVDRSVKKFEAPITLIITTCLWLFMLYGKVNRLMGVILVLGLIGYIAKHLIDVKKNPKVEKEDKITLSAFQKSFAFLWVFVGVAVLVAGGYLLVEGAIGVAHKFKISDRIIGLTVVAIGTSLPEFAASFVAVIRKVPNMALGNILGSNVYNILMVLGVVAIVDPINFAPRFLKQDMPVLMVVTIFLCALITFRKVLGRFAGVLLLLSYAGYLYIIF